MKKNNKGITLVELIVTMAIVVIVGASIISFMVIGINSYKNSNAEVDIQNEAQLTNNQIKDMLIDVSAGIGYYINNTPMVNDSTAADGSNIQVAAISDEELDVQEKELRFFDWADGGVDKSGTEIQKNIVSNIKWDENARQLLYSSYEYDKTTDSLVPVIENQLMAEYVSGFSVDLSKMESSNQVGYTITFEKKNRSYSATNTVTLRNNVKVNESVQNKVFEDLIIQDSVVKSVTVEPSECVLIQGTKDFAFSATVNGDGYPSNEVTWEITGNHKPGTKINANGQLTLADDEESQAIQVIATSKQNSSIKSDSAKVMTRFISGASWKKGSSSDAGRMQTIDLKLSGKQLESETFNPTINFTATYGNGDALSPGTFSWTMPQNVEIDQNKESASYNGIEFKFSNVKDNRSIKVTASITGFGSAKISLSNITFKMEPAVQPITGIRLVPVSDDNQSIPDKGDTIDRGDSKSYKVQVSRDNGTTYFDPDSTVDVQWTLPTTKKNNNDKPFADINVKDNKEVSIKVLKDPEALAYDEDYTTTSNGEPITVKARNTGTSGDDGWYDTMINYQIPKVTVSLSSVAEGYGNDIPDIVPGQTINCVAEITGLKLTPGEDELYLSNVNDEKVVASNSFIKGYDMNEKEILFSISVSEYKSKKSCESVGMKLSVTDNKISNHGVSATINFEKYNNGNVKSYNSTLKKYVRSISTGDKKNLYEWTKFYTITLVDGTEVEYYYFKYIIYETEYRIKIGNQWYKKSYNDWKSI